jgi:3-oxoacyl-[acyl-carrier-protein] synthase II
MEPMMEHTPSERVVITGLGLRCGLGRTAEEFGTALFAGRTCIRPLEGFQIDDDRFTLGGQIPDFDFEAELPDADGKRMLRFSQLAMVAADGAIRDAALPLDRMDTTRVGTAFGTAVAGAGETFHEEGRRFFARGGRGVTPTAYAEYTPSACTTHVAIHFGLRGPVSSHSSGCVTGVDTLLWGVEQIRRGQADVMVVGGSDAPFFPLLWAGVYRSGILAPVPDDGGSVPRPFSHDHAGIALVEGGSAVILERDTHARLRGARIYAEVLGGVSVDSGEPLTKLDPDGGIFAETIARALRDAGLPPTAIDWVCAHGTGHPIGDGAESRGIERGLGAHAFCVPVSSIRGAVGQSFASGGGFQVAAACLAIREQRVPPTINFSAPAEGCRLDYVPNTARTARVRQVLINAAGIGGVHTALVLGAYTS